MPLYSFSKKILRIPNLERFLNDEVTTDIKFATAIIGWGKRPSTRHARVYAKTHNLPYIALEDGFIHSLGQGILGYHSCSMVLDPVGIYYDATTPSTLENILCDTESKLLTTQHCLRTYKLIKELTFNNISKYNNSPLFNEVLEKSKKHVLLIDQTIEDMSLQYGYADKDTFRLMLESALNENPDAEIIIKTHPDVITGKKNGCFSLDKKNKRIRIISELINPISLIKQVDSVYVATSQLGFEALLLGKLVVCFGVPFYAGWGVTDDRADKQLPVFQRRNISRSINEIFTASYILYSHYIHPDTRAPCQLEEIIEYFKLQYKYFVINQGEIYCFGLSRSFWKKNYIKYFLKSPKNEIIFPHSIEKALQRGLSINSKILIWGHRNYENIYAQAKKLHITPWHIEDGFIRSVGLGSDLTAPLSLVVDTQGIYYDPSQPSDLENLIQHYNFTEEQIKRAENIRKSLLINSVSKYNVGQALPSIIIQARTNQRIILVVGQVEDDISILKGCIDIKTNYLLLRIVRETFPDAYIIYKPHPDVISGNRIGHIPIEIIHQYCNLVLDDISITDCLDIVHEVHTMTSLVGFEALLRSIPVTCYGIPFYAGWGLTHDRHNIPRRTRQITLQQLIAATLILYPRYINWHTNAFTTPETAIDMLSKQISQQGGKMSVKMPWWKRTSQKVFNSIYGMLIR